MLSRASLEVFVIAGSAPSSRATVKLSIASLVLLAACFLTYRPWKGFSAQKGVPIISETTRIADNLYRPGEFANPFGTLPTGYTAHIAPAYPIMLSWSLRVFGEGAEGWLAPRCLPVLALGLQLALLPWCAPIFGFSSRTGVLAGVFALLAKPLCSEQWEAQEAGLLILILAAAVGYCSAHSPVAAVALLTGLVAGLTICFEPAIAPAYLGWLLFIARRTGLREWRAILLWIAPLLVCAPWMVRNQLRLGTSAIRDDLGIELNVSFNDCAPFGFEQSQRQGCFGQYHPNQNLAEALAVRRLGEASYNQDRMRRAFSWIVQHPGRSVELAAERVWFFWFPPNDRWPEFLRNRKQNLIFQVLTLASIGGLWLSCKNRLPGLPVLGILLGLFPLVYYVVQFDPRYRYPILWVTWLEAASFFTTFVTERRLWGNGRPENTMK